MEERKETHFVFKALDKIDSAVAPIILVILFGDVLLQILSRILPGNALPWTNEVGECGLGALIWFGISVAVRDNNHVRFDLIAKKFSGTARKYVGALGYLVFTVYLVWLAVLTIELLGQYLKLESRTTVLGISLFWIRLPILIGCVTASLRLIVKQYNIVTGREEAFVTGDHLD